MGSANRNEDANREWAVLASRLIVGDGAPPYQDAVLLVRGDRIVMVGRRKEIQLPPNTTVFDLGDETVLPGFIDTHNHPSLKPIGVEASDYIPGQFYDPDSRLTARAIRNVRIDLLSGVTTLRCMGELNFIDVTLASDIEQGLVAGPHIVPSGPQMAPTGGHHWIPEWSVDGAENVRRAIANYVQHGSKVIKICLLDETPETTSYSDEELSAAVDEAHRQGVPIAAHCTGPWGSSIRGCVKTGIDVIEHAVPLNEQIVGEVAASKTTFSLTPFCYKLHWPRRSEYWEFQDSHARSAKEWMDFNAAAGVEYLEANPEVMTKDRYFGREVFPALEPWMNAVKQAWQAGIPMAVGSDAPHGIYPLNIEFLVDCGIPPLDAIGAGTGMAARVIGIGDVTGTLQPGKRADFISVRGNPLQNIRLLRDINLVVRSGIRYDHLSFQ